MAHSPSRRSLLLAAVTIPFSAVCMPLLANTKPSNRTSMQKKLAALEKSSGGRLGISAIDTGNDALFQYRAEERFAMCCTFKVMVAAAMLKQSEADESLLQQIVNYSQSDLVPYSPVAQNHINDGLSIGELCKAMLTYSDNTAANILMKLLGGPEAVTKFARSIGDDAFRLNRWEPELNSAVPDDDRDTTTPYAMQQSLRKLALGNALAQPQRELLQEWLKANTTGANGIKAGVPENWTVGDKTGSGAYGVTNDIAVIWRPDGKPIVMTIYFRRNSPDATAKKELIASATRILVDMINKNAG